MKPLDDTKSWDLFGEEILKRCGGLPLAISVVGDLLAPELKACFLCLAFFKEDTVIKVTKLVQIWVAHGLVPREVEGGGEEEVRTEEIERDYLNELISRNMVQVKEMAYDVIKGCQVHDLLRDLSIRKAEEEINFEMIREESNSLKCSFNKPRHRVIYYDGRSFVYYTNGNQYLRSLFINREYPYPLSIFDASFYWKSFELLKFPDLGNAMFIKLPKGIGELTGLKYLKLYIWGQERLPSSWAKLKNLEVLDLRDQFSTGCIKIDKVIEKMESLRHLYAIVKSCRVDTGKMTKLRTLHMFRLNKSGSNVWEIQGLSGVSKLGIDFCNSHGPNSSLFTCLSSLPNLVHLILQNSYSTDVEGLISLDRVTRLNLGIDMFKADDSRHSMPAYFPPNLSHLTLSNIWLEEDSMPVLGKQPHLFYLKIKNARIDSGITEITIGGFPKLKVLHLHNIQRWRKIEIEESAMSEQELNQFIVNYCPYLDVENVPERLRSVMIVQSQ